MVRLQMNSSADVARVKGIFQSLFRVSCSIAGLIGILTVTFLPQVPFTVLASVDTLFYLLLHVQNTVFTLLFASTKFVIVIWALFTAKRYIWYIWGSETPEFEPLSKSNKELTEEVIEKARQKGNKWLKRGFEIAYGFALLNIYQIPVGSTVWDADYPDIPYLESVLDPISTLPLISQADVITNSLSINHPLEYVVLTTVIAPMILGLWNYHYVFKHNRLLRNPVSEGIKWGELSYFGLMLVGVLCILSVASIEILFTV